eukprot:1161131-Pelagomonas_calceolata.AAC.3
MCPPASCGKMCIGCRCRIHAGCKQDADAGYEKKRARPSIMPCCNMSSCTLWEDVYRMQVQDTCRMQQDAYAGYKRRRAWPSIEPLSDGVPSFFSFDEAMLVR